jgi:hypothetical protein
VPNAMDNLIFASVSLNSITILHIVFPLPFVLNAILLDGLASSILFVLFKLAFILNKRLNKFTITTELPFLKITNILEVWTN